MEPLNLSCISASISFVRRKVTDEILGFAYAITVTFFVTLEVYPRESVTVDEPVLGFDAIMRVEFYDMLTQSFQKHPRIIIVSTHIIEEIAKTIQKLIIIDKGSIRFFDTLQSVETKAFSISGLQKDVEAVTQNLNVIGQDTVGGLMTSYIFDYPPEQTAALEIHPLSLQDFFIQMVGHKGGAIK